MKKLLYFSVFIVFALFAITLNLKNPQAIPVNYYFGISWEISLFWVIMLPFFVGMVLGVLVMGLSVFKTKLSAGKSKKALLKAEREMENLRVAPAQTKTASNVATTSISG